MEKRIEELYRAKMEDGTVDKIIRAAIDKMIAEACSDLMGYNGSVKKMMKEQIEPLLIQAIERSDLAHMTIKLTDIINQSIQNTGVSMYADLIKGVRALCSTPDIATDQPVKLSEIFACYRNYVAEQYDESDFESDDICYDDGEKTASIECHLEVEIVRDTSYYSNRQKTIVRLHNAIGLEREDGTCFSFEVREIGGVPHVRTGFEYSLLDIRRMPEFAVYLMALEQQYAKIEVDITMESDDAICELEYS